MKLAIRLTFILLVLSGMLSIILDAPIEVIKGCTLTIILMYVFTVRGKK